jgi:hypothetical protein
LTDNTQVFILYTRNKKEGNKGNNVFGIAIQDVLKILPLEKEVFLCTDSGVGMKQPGGEGSYSIGIMVGIDGKRLGESC